MGNIFQVSHILRCFFAIDLFSNALFQTFDYFWKHVPTMLIISLCFCIDILYIKFTDLSTLTVSPRVALFHYLSQGLTVGSSFLMVIQFLSGSFSQTHSFLKKETKAAHPNANKERISSMINNNKTNIRSSLSLRWALLFIMSVETHIGYPFHWKTQSDFLKIAKKFTAKYNTSHFSK